MIGINGIILSWPFRWNQICPEQWSVLSPPVGGMYVLPLKYKVKFCMKNRSVKKKNWGSGSLCLASSVLTLCHPMDCSPPGSCVHGDSPIKYTGRGCHILPLQGILPTQGLNPGLPHCKQILYHPSHQGSPRILEWVAYPFSRGPFWPRNQTRVFCIAGGFFTSWATREELVKETVKRRWDLEMEHLRLNFN